MTHPARSIELVPPEILAAIFTMAQPKRRSRYIKPFEIIISHVSARWRGVAIDTPFLWTNIDVYSPHSLERVSAYLERSAPCPIDVRFDIWLFDSRQLDSRSTESMISSIVDIAIIHIARWRTLFVFSHHQRTTDSILTKISDLAAPILERLRIINDGEGESDVIAQQNGRILAGGAPCLSTVQMNNIQYLPLLANVTTLNLHSLGNFQTSTIDIDVLTDLAEACPFLTNLSIHGDMDVETWPIRGPTKPVMKSLRLLGFVGGDTFPAQFLTSISLPQLVSLWLDCSPTNHFINLLTNSTPRPTFPALRYLAIQQFDFYASSQFSKLFPSVKFLYFPYCKPFHSTFLKYTLLEDPMRWPHLHTLVFTTSRDTHIKKFSQVLEDIINSRHNRGNPIKRILFDKDAFMTLPNRDSLGAVTVLEQLQPENYDDPWWRIAHDDTGDLR